MGRSSRIFTFTLVALALSVPALAQPAVRADEWARGTTLTGFTGAAVDSTRTGPMFGGSVGWELTPRIAIEGSGLWVYHEANTSAFAGVAKVQASLLGPHKAVPFLQAGIGLYRASFHPSRAATPSFYQRRMGPDGAGHVGLRTFTDPSVVLGGGANVFLSRNLAIRPDVETMVVLRNARSHVVTAVRVHVVYHFEDHPVTPARRGR